MIRLLAWFAGLVIAATACTPALPSTAPASADETTVTVGVGPDAESQLLGHVMQQLLAAAGIPATVERFDDRAAVRQALELHTVEVTAGYTGQAWLEVLGRPDPPGDPRVSFREVREADAADGLIWMRPAFADVVGPRRPPTDATFALFVRAPPLAEAPDLRNMTEFAARVTGSDDHARVCVAPEFAERSDGLSAVWRAYSVDPDRSYVPAEPEEALRGVAVGDCLAGLASATSGLARSLNLRPLVDDRRVFPAFVVTPVVVEEATQHHEGLLKALRPLAEQLTTRRLGTWNARVAAGVPVGDVAAAAAEALRAGRKVNRPG